MRGRYTYDAEGRRVGSFGGASCSFRYVYSGLNIVYEVPDGGGTPTLRLYAGGQQVAEKTGSTVTYLHQDHLGSTRLKTNSSGNTSSPATTSLLSSTMVARAPEFRYPEKPSD